jgi:aspartyl-tRNA(Asn)/glutamyl-tRNA(Gln) amidotransferase subunit A
LLEEGSQLAAHEYDLALETQRLAKEFFWSLELWKEPQLWAIIMPATPTAAPSTATTGDPVFNSPWSFTGLPSITIPYAESSEGLPLGMQIVHRYSCELLRIAQDFETFLSWKRHPKLMGAN